MNVHSTLILTIALSIALLVSCGDHDHNGHGHHHHIDAIEIIDRGDTAQPVVATWTSDEGWTGTSELPEISLASSNQRISLGVRAISEDGEDLIAHDDHLEARYALASGAPEGIVDMDMEESVVFHGDHVHIYGLAEGTTQVRFLIWHDDHADAETDPISVTVVD